MKNVDTSDLLKILQENPDSAVFVLNTKTNQLIYTNKVADETINDTSNLHHLCYKNIFFDSVTSCFAYKNTALGIPNRRKFDYDLANALKNNQKGALVMLNLKGFNAINTEYGYEQSNQVLAGIAVHLRDELPVKNSVYHGGSDKFLFLLPEVEEDVLKKFLFELSRSFENPLHFGAIQCAVSCDIAAINFPEHGKVAAELLQNLASALEISRKANISNAITYFNRNLKDTMQKHAEMQWAMSNAVNEGFKEFEVYHQPIIDVATMKWVGTEALLRWNSKEFGFLSPNSFLEVAENSGLIVPIGNYVLESALNFVQELALPKTKPFHVSINLSPYQLQDINLVNDIDKILKLTGFTPRELVLEIGDLSASNKSNRMILKNLRDLKTLNCSVALDDFGLENSDLYDFSGQRGILKIGRSITAGIESDPFMQTFMKTVIELSKVMELDVCAKGVETEAQFSTMKDYKCTYIQGYYFCRPLTADAFKRMLSDNI